MGLWPFKSKPKKPQWRLNLSSAVGHDVNLAAAWTVYAGTIVLARRDAAEKPAAPRLSPFDEESQAREQLAEFWEAKGKQKPVRDPYLDLLVSVRAAGFVREYTWRFLRRPDWPQPPNLKLDAFDAWWTARGIPQHKPLTLAFVSAA